LTVRQDIPRSVGNRQFIIIRSIHRQAHCELNIALIEGSIGTLERKLNLDKVEKTLKFKVEKETKNTVKHNEVPAEGQPPIIGTLYVQKWFAGNAAEIEVTIKK
jgi:hypothetical protein